jgi:hypothetical protein
VAGGWLAACLPQWSSPSSFSFSPLPVEVQAVEFIGVAQAVATDMVVVIPVAAAGLAAVALRAGGKYRNSHEIFQTNQTLAPP